MAIIFYDEMRLREVSWQAEWAGVEYHLWNVLRGNQENAVPLLDRYGIRIEVEIDTDQGDEPDPPPRPLPGQSFLRAVPKAA